MLVSEMAVDHDSTLLDSSSSKKDAHVSSSEELAALDLQLSDLISSASSSPSSLSTSLESALALEKKARLSADLAPTKRCALAILEMCFNAKDWSLLMEHVVLLSKRRAQLKQVVASMIQKVMNEYLQKTPNLETKIKLIECLNGVAAGKIFVEMERARLTLQLARIHEEQGKIKEAGEVLQEVAVETFGAMAKTEKIAFILEQVRLALDRQDYVRAQILSRKVSHRAFADADESKDAEGKKKLSSVVQPPAEGTPSLLELKGRYHKLMIRYYMHDDEYLEACRQYQSLYEDARKAVSKGDEANADTMETDADAETYLPYLQRVCWLVCLSTSGPMQKSLLEQTRTDKAVRDMLPAHHELLTAFGNAEVIGWPELDAKISKALEKEIDVFGAKGSDVRERRVGHLKQRVTEPGILVIAKYYRRITPTRVGELLGLSASDAEKRICTMVNEGHIACKIDRVVGVVDFATAKGESPAAVLDSYAASVRDVVGLVERSSHQISREMQRHGLASKA